MSVVKSRYPARFDLVCVKLGEYILLGDIYVGNRNKEGMYRDYLAGGEKWYRTRYEAILREGSVGEKKEKLTNGEWVRSGPGGYWVLRPVFEEPDNEFGPVSP